MDGLYRLLYTDEAACVKYISNSITDMTTSLPASLIFNILLCSTIINKSFTDCL